MARFDVRQRGNRKQLARIRWKRSEIVHAIVLFLLLTVFTIWVGIWIATHPFD
ncbi:MAG TPA: hypothetical protein VJS11_09185 [Acidobacteriaceae bacterium]|nr:hypothetical protein [Acidobacteriaceae bacterium]